MEIPIRCGVFRRNKDGNINRILLQHPHLSTNDLRHINGRHSILIHSKTILNALITERQYFACWNWKHRGYFLSHETQGSLGYRGRNF